MKPGVRFGLLLFSLLCFQTIASGQDSYEHHISLDAPVLESKDIMQSIQYVVSNSFNSKVQVECFQLRGTDTILLYDMYSNDIKFKKGANITIINLSKSNRRRYVNHSFFDAIKKFDAIPPGVYVTNMVIFNTDSNTSISNNYYWQIDSSLAFNSPLRNNINSSFKESKLLKGANVNSTKRTSERSYNNALNSVERKLSKIKGVNSIKKSVNGKDIIAVYYEHWFMGHYQVDDERGIKKKIPKEMSELNSKPASLAGNNIESFTSLNSQMKKLYKQGKENEITGRIEFNSFFSNGQEPGSGQDENYQDINGVVNTEVLDIPIEVQGYYTTQDRNRKVKASFFNVRYDFAKKKSEMSELTSDYKSKYDETMSKGKGSSQIYNTYISTLTGKKKTILNELKNEYGVDEDYLKKNYSQNVRFNDNDISREADDNLNLKKIGANKDKIESKYKQIESIEKDINKYEQLIKQFGEKMFIDSAMNYSKLKKLESYDDVSYKQMVKAADGILPNGKVSKFMAGLTKINLGIINKYESSYTMAGQTLKGGEIGYDFRFFQLGLSGGRTEYISRGGEVDKYSSYMATVNFKPARNNKSSLIYYTYSPSRSMLKEDFFKDVDMALPTFKKPTHIVSVTHEGTVAKNLLVQAEGAYSFKSNTASEGPNKDNIALKPAVIFMIPRTTALFKGEWEYVGKQFENNSLPYTRAATERYTLSTEADFFKSFLSVGVQYNYLMQQTFASTGYSTRWGFDVKTRSKRWPNILVAYKPFTTFRTYDDTFSIQQRPLVGEVWITKGTYQIRRKDISHRFICMFNQNRSEVDTVQYHSKNLNVGYIYTKASNTLNVNVGWMSTPMYILGVSVKTTNYFINGSLAYKVSSRIYALLSEDIGWAQFGLQRTSTMLGGIYSFRKPNIELRLQARYSNIKQAEKTAPLHLWAGQLGLAWTFKGKVNGKE